MENTMTKELHSKILNQENQKSKKKRVSFSIFTADTLEEMEELRKKREKEFFYMIDLKSKVNETLKVGKSYGKSNSEEVKLDVDERLRVNPNFSGVDIDQVKDRFSKTTNPNNEIVKVENIFLNNQVFKIENNAQSDSSLSNANNYFSDNLNTLNTNSLSVKSPKENILFSQSNLSQVEEKTERENDHLEVNDEHKNDIEQIENNDHIELNEHEGQLTSLSAQLNTHNQNHNQNENTNNINSIEIEEIQMRGENPEIISEINSNIFTIHNFAVILNQTLQKREDLIQKEICDNYLDYFYQFFNNLNEKVKFLEDKFLDTQVWEESKISHFRMRKFFTRFRDNINSFIRSNKFESYNINQCKKFILYRDHKLKNKIFEHLKKYTQKRREWINTIRREIKMNTIWKCFDGLKLYVNYRLIKRYLNNKKKAKIFSALKSNINTCKELDRKSCLLKYILISKNFLTKIRKQTLISKNKKYNKILSSEFNRSLLLKKIFGVLIEYHKLMSKSKRSIKEKFNDKIKNSEFIQIKVLQKQTTKIINLEENKICKKIIKSNIKII